MGDQTANQPMAELIRNYILERRNNKEIKFLKGRQDKKGIGGINYKLLEQLKSGLSKEKVEDVEKKIKNKMTLLSEKKKYEMLVSKAEKHDLSVKIIIDEYQTLLKNVENEHDYNTWLSWAAEKADGVSLANVRRNLATGPVTF